MRLLFINSKIEKGFEFNRALHAAFSKHVSDYHCLSFADKMSSAGSKERVNDEIVTYAKFHRPDIIFLQVIDVGAIYISTIKELSKISLVICWSGDVYPTPDNKAPSWVFDIAPYVVSCFSNMQYVNEVQEKGYPAYFINHYHEEAYYPIPNTEKIYDITFVASFFEKYPLSKERNELIDLLYKKYPNQFHLFGDNWSGRYNAKYISREESNLVYNQSKIAINYSNYSISHYTSDRLMHIMGSGCFCLCKHYPDAEKDLGADAYNVKYFNTKELFYLIEHYLKDDESRQNIAGRGYDNIKNIFGDKALITRITQIMQDYLNKEIGAGLIPDGIEGKQTESALIKHRNK